MQYRLGDYTLDVRRFEVRKGGFRLPAEPQVLSLLFLLVEKRDRLVSKEELVASVWSGRAVSDSAISSRIKSARQLLGDNGEAQRLIRTVHGKGFRFVGEISAYDPDPKNAASIGVVPNALRVAGGAQTHNVSVAVVALAATLLIGLAVRRPWQDREPLSVAVTPATATPGAEEAARDLTAKLGMLTSVIEAAPRLLDKREQKKADLFFQVDTSNQGGDAETNLVFLNNKHEVLWSGEFRRPNAQAGDLKQELAFSAGTVLQCALEASSDPERLDRQTLKIFLGACADYTRASEQTVRDLRDSFDQVTRSAPRFQPALKRLLVADSEIVQDFNFDEREVVSDRTRLERDIVAARQVNSEMPEIFLAAAVMAPIADYSQRIGLADEAVERGPSDAQLLGFRARFLMQVGRMRDAASDTRKAVRLDPLSPATRENLIVALASSDKMPEAKEELRKAEQLWPGAASLLEARYLLYLRFGDPKEAIRIRNSGLLNVSGAPYHGAFLEARAAPSASNVARALHDARSIFSKNPLAITDLAQALVAFGKEDELFTILLQSSQPYDLDDLLEVLFRPAFRKFHHDPRMMKVAARLGLLQYWQSSGRWPDFCFDPDLPYDCRRSSRRR